MKRVIYEHDGVTVANVIMIGDDAPDTTDVYVDVEDDTFVGPGMKLQDGKYVSVPAPVPLSVTPLQFRKALRKIGLMDTVKAFVTTQSDTIVEAWEYATQIDRNNEFIVCAAKSLGITDSMGDDIFRLAATL